VGYLAAVLDDLEAVANVDPRRVYATGFSNGGMMCYRLASELSGRIAAIAPVAGTMSTAVVQAKRPVSVSTSTGPGTPSSATAGGSGGSWGLPVPGGRRDGPVLGGVQRLPRDAGRGRAPRVADDGLVIRRLVFGPGRDGSEVVLYAIEGGGHTWPGREPIGAFLGATALDLKATT
jgi:polyhydroxybutyrate depolymerase